jgi:hypothetical protein
MPEPVETIAEPQTAAAPRRGLTLRSVVVCVVALFIMAAWIEYEELYNTYGGPLAENSPPNSAVGVIWALLVVSTLLYTVRRALRLTAAELVVIYSALVLAAPLMTQGMWHRLFGLLAAIPHNQDFKSYQSLPPMLWPRGPNLVANGRFENGLDGFTHAGGGSLAWEDATIKGDRLWKSPSLSNAGDPGARATLRWSIARRDERGREALVPGENFFFSMLVKGDGFAKGSSYFVRMQADDGPEQSLLVNTETTRPTFALPGGFQRVGANPVKLPGDLKEDLTFSVGLSGEGRITLQDIEFFNVEAVEGAYAGRKIVRESQLATLEESERDFTIVRPDNLLSLAGLRYLLTGYIPLDQWVRPAIAWSALVAGLFAGFLGLNVLMRKQWVEHERFTFPLTILPRNLFEEATDERGRLYRPIFRNRVMWIGFGVTLALVLLKGLKFYYPQVPAPVFYVPSFAEYVTSPVLKAFLQNVGTGMGLAFCVLAVALLIETDILLSLWSFFLLFQLWNLCGRAFGFTRFPGYPWEFQQAMGAFIAYALIAVVVGRHHLAKVVRIALGRGSAADADGQKREVVSYRTALGLVAASLIAMVAWGVWTEMGALASLFFFGYMLVCGFAASKIRAECGAPFGYMTPYYGMQFVGALGGFAVFHSTGMLVATIASGFMCVSVFLLIAPTQVEMMQLGQQFRVRPRDVGAGLTLGLLGGLFLGGFVLLCWMYGLGANNLKTSWPYEQNWYFNTYRAGEATADRAFAAETLGSSPESQPLNVLHNPDAKGLGIGAATTGALAFLRAKFTWFPFHPLGYVLASSHFMRGAWLLLFLAWLVRQVVFRIGGAQVIRRGLVPFSVGMFLACIASIVIFDIVGMYLRSRGVTEVYAGMP